MRNLLNRCETAMFAFIPRSVMPLAAGALLFMGTPSAFAQTKINMTTAQGSCVAVVNDPAGVTLASNGTTELQANGVVLSASPANACTPPGSASANFSANVQISASSTPGIPYTPAVGAPFYVIWSTSPDATVCTRTGGSTTGLTGWNTLTPACTTAGACAGSHAEQVSAIAGGAYNFGVTCTNASGYASQTVTMPNPTVPAPTPNPIPLVAPSTANAGVTFVVTWPTMTNATSCSGTATIGGTPITVLGDWTSLTSPTSPRNVSVPVSSTGNLALTLTCWNSDHSASATGTTGNIVVAASTTGSCPSTISSMPGGTRTLLSTSDISYGAYANPKRLAANLLEWDDVWGHNDASGGVTSWPGVNGASPVIRQFKKTSYMGIHFRTPLASQIPVGRHGAFRNPSFVGGPNLTMAISAACGDFSASLPTPGCLADHEYGNPLGSGISTSDIQMVYWHFDTANPATTCVLQPDTDYYVNIIQTDPTSTKSCVAGFTCPSPAPMQNFQ